jgi:hypothetical protein
MFTEELDIIRDGKKYEVERILEINLTNVYR